MPSIYRYRTVKNIFGDPGADYLGRNEVNIAAEIGANKSLQDELLYTFVRTDFHSFVYLISTLPGSPRMSDF